MIDLWMKGTGHRRRDQDRGRGGALDRDLEDGGWQDIKYAIAGA